MYVRVRETLGLSAAEATDSKEDEKETAPKAKV
jgi:hypothetical protein